MIQAPVKNPANRQRTIHNPGTIQNPIAIRPQSVHETAGEYRTRGTPESHVMLSSPDIHRSNWNSRTNPIPTQQRTTQVRYTTQSNICHILHHLGEGPHQIIQAYIPSDIHWAFFIQSLPNTRHINDSSPSQNLKRRQSYSQSKILQQSGCNRRTKRPGNIEPGEDICHVHFNPNKIRRHPYEQKYCIIHSNSSLFRKTGSLSIAVSDFGSMNTIEHKVRALMFCCGTMCFSAVGIVPQQKSKSFYNPKIPP